MSDDLPLCQTGPYGPAVIACGDLAATQRPVQTALRPSLPGPGILSTRGYRMLAIVRGGAVIAPDEGSEARLPEGAVALVPPGLTGTLRIAPRSHILHLLFDLGGPRRWRRTTPILAETVLPPPRVVWGVDPGLVLPEALTERANAELKRIRLEYWRSTDGWLQANARLAFLLADIIAQCRAPATAGAQRAVEGATGDALDRARAVVETMLADGIPVSVVDLAHAAGCSSRHLHRQFCARWGKTPSEWLESRRLDRAADLAMSGLAVAEVARRTGYASAAAFVRAFRRRFGTTPGKYRPAR